MKALLLMGAAVLSAGVVKASDEEICSRMHYPGVAAPESRTQQIAQELVNKFGLNKAVMVCMLDYHQTLFPIMGTRFLNDGRLSVVISEELECDATEDGLRGLVAHEVAHYLVEDYLNAGMGRSLTDEQKIEFESTVDRRAVDLVGHASVQAGLTDMSRISKASVSHWLDHFNHEMDERTRWLDAK